MISNTDTARNITLTLRQRIVLDEIVSTQKDKPRDSLKVFHRVHQKLQLTPEQKADLLDRKVILQTAQSVLIDEVAADAEPLIEVWFECEEVMRVRKLLNDMNYPSVAMMDSTEPVLEQLEARIEADTSHRPVAVSVQIPAKTA